MTYLVNLLINFFNADDTKIMGQISEHEDGKRAINWYGSNKPKFNFDKFSILEFSYKTTSDEKDSSEDFIAKAIPIKKREKDGKQRIIFLGTT